MGITGWVLEGWLLVLFVLFGGLDVAFGMSREVECRKGIRVLAVGSQTVTGFSG